MVTFNKVRKNEEAHLVRQVLDYLHLKKHYAKRVKTVGIMRNNRYTYDKDLCKGHPDIIAFTPELRYFECKSPKGRLSPDQETFGLLCKNAGVFYMVVKDLQDVIDVVG